MDEKARFRKKMKHYKQVWEDREKKGLIFTIGGSIGKKPAKRKKKVK